jgi:hypothetical protein
MLLAAGFCAGEEADIVPSNAGNPRGYHENVRVLEANERILRRLNATWFDPPTDEDLEAASPEESEQLERLLSALREQAQGLPLAMKDPRIGVLLPLWGPILQGVLHPLVVVRHPLDIAYSLRARDGTEPHNGLAAWELHMTRLLQRLHGERVTVVQHHSLLATSRGPRWVVETVSRQLADQYVDKIDPAAADDAFDRGLVHHQTQVADLDQWLTGFQRELWDYLRQLRDGAQAVQVPEGLRRATAAARESVAAERGRLDILVDLERQRRAIAEQHRALDEHRQARSELAADLRKHSSALRSLNS